MRAHINLAPHRCLHDLLAMSFGKTRQSRWKQFPPAEGDPAGAALFQHSARNPFPRSCLETAGAGQSHRQMSLAFLVSAMQKFRMLEPSPRAAAAWLIGSRKLVVANARNFVDRSLISLVYSKAASSASRVLTAISSRTAPSWARTRILALCASRTTRRRRASSSPSQTRSSRNGLPTRSSSRRERK